MENSSKNHVLNLKNSGQAELVDILGLVLLMVGAIVFAILVLPELVKSIYGLLALSSAEVAARDVAGLITISGAAPQNIIIKHAAHSSYKYDVNIGDRLLQVKLLTTDYGMKGTAISKTAVSDIQHNPSDPVNCFIISKNLKSGESLFDIESLFSSEPLECKIPVRDEGGEVSSQTAPSASCESQCQLSDFGTGVCRKTTSDFTKTTSNFIIKGANVGANQLVSVSSSYPKQYWAFPEEDYAWKTLQDLGINLIQVQGGVEGNVLHIQANENHPWDRAYDPNWAQNLDNFLAKADSYGIKIVFHSMGSKYGTGLGIVAPMHNYRRIDPHSSIENAFSVIDKLGGNNELGKNFFIDDRIAWWSPINEARLNYNDIKEWTVTVLQRIKSYGGKTSVCVNDGEHRYVETFPYIIPIIGEYVDYLQAHSYNDDVIHEMTNQGPAGDMYQPAYEAFSSDFQSMINGRGDFSVDQLILSEFGCGSGTWKWHGGTDTTTAHQQADYIRAAFDAAESQGIPHMIWHEPIRIRTDVNTFGFIEYDGTIIEEPYNAFKSADLSPEISTEVHEFPERFHGINIMPTNQRWRGHDIRAELEKIKSWGFNAIRFHGINWDAITPDRYDMIDEAYFDEMKDEHGGITINEWIEICTELQLYIMLDIHYFGTPWADCPDWAFNGESPRNRNAWDMMMRGDADDELESIKNIWVYIAKRYADNPYVIIDVFNEPRIADGPYQVGDISNNPLPKDKIATSYKAFNEDLIKEIRAVEKTKHIIVIEYYSELDIPDNIEGDEWVYRDTHFYNPWEKPYTRKDNGQWLKSQLKKRIDLLSTTGLNVQIGEFGRILYPEPHEGSVTWFNDMFKAMEELGIKDWYYFTHPGFVLSPESYGFLDENGDPIEPYFSIVTNEAKKGTSNGITTAEVCDIYQGEESIGQDGCAVGEICCCSGELSPPPKPHDFKKFIVLYGSYSPSDADLDYLASNFDFIDTGRDRCENVAYLKEKNPDIIVVFYKNLIGIYDWEETNENEDWFLHETGGDSKEYRIIRKGWEWYLMDPGSDGWRNHYAEQVKAELDRCPHYDGVFADDCWGDFYENYFINDPDNLPKITKEEWTNDINGMLEVIKNQIGDKLIIVNSNTAFDYIEYADGRMDEGFAHANWQGPDEFQSVWSWERDIDALYQWGENDKYFMAMGGVEDATDDQKQSFMRFCLSSYLMGVNGPKAVFGFSDKYSWGVRDQWLYPEYDRVGELGDPIGKHYSEGSIYVRDFENGKVLVNPSSGTDSINLDQNYKTLDGKEVSSITLAPHSGEILLKVSVSKNLILNPDFDDGKNNWDTYDQEEDWWKIDNNVYKTESPGLRCDIPSWDDVNPTSLELWKNRGRAYAHMWNKQVSVQPGQRVQARGWIKAGNAWGRVGFDFRGTRPDGSYGITRGFTSPVAGYNEDWTYVSLIEDSDIRGFDNRVDGPQTLEVQPGEDTVLFYFAVNKDKGDTTAGSVWFDDAELYVTSE